MSKEFDKEFNNVLKEHAEAQREKIFREEMKKRICKNCFYWLHNRCYNHNLNGYMDEATWFRSPETFGCNQWKERDEERILTEDTIVISKGHKEE